MKNSSNISVDTQKTIITTANSVAKEFAKYCADKKGKAKVFSDNDICDIAGDAIYKACKYYSSFDSDKGYKLSTWVRSITVKCGLNALDYKMKHLPLSFPMYANNSDDGEEFDYTECCPEHSSFTTKVENMLDEYEADKYIIQQEFNTLVEDEISKLSSENRQFVGMMQDGKKAKAMAEKCGCSANAAAKRVFDIRKKLSEPIGAIADEFGYSTFRKAAIK